MKEFEYIIIGGGCAGLSLAYELEINEKFKGKIVTKISKSKNYNKAEDYHQKYLEKSF